MSQVIDCDSHVMEPADLWQKYLEPKYRDRAIRIERRDGVEHLIIGEVSVLSNVLAGLGGAHLPRETVFFGEISLSGDVRPAPQAELRLKEAAKLGFTRAVAPASRKGGESVRLTTTPIASVASLVAEIAAAGVATKTAKAR